MKYFILFCLLLGMASAQHSFKGRVLDPKGRPLFAANVIDLAQKRKGTLTDMDGLFTWEGHRKDSLLIIFPGYEEEILALSQVTPDSLFTLRLSEKSISLEEVSIRARKPISEQFAVTRLDKLDIYLNPLSAADPLRAITLLPSSTNTQETANPSLRGSAANRSRVILNGVPIYQPVRNSQINGLGNFSLFNTEVIESQYVYASNPPLTFGNSSGGLVQIETEESLEQNSWQLGLSLANLGIFRNQKLGEEAFIQVYGNLQFSEAFIGIQPEALGFLKSFATQDLGLHLHLPLGRGWNFKLFSYGISENYEVETQVFAYKGRAMGTKERSFHLGRLRWQGQSSTFNLHMGTDLSRSRYSFGNIRSHTQTQQAYAALSYKDFVGKTFSWQVGANYDGYRRSFEDTVSRFFFANDPRIPTQAVDTQISRPLVEGHLYANWQPLEGLSLSAGIRSNVPLQGQTPFFSFQASSRYSPGNKHSFLLSGGRYHSYMLPNFFFRGNELLQSDQIALDYSFQEESGRVGAAIYAKDEKGLQQEDFLTFRRSRVLGAEINWQQDIGKYLGFEISNTYLIHRIRFSEEGESFPGSRDLPFFIKSSISYNNPSLFSLNLTYMGRPGTYVTPIEEARYRSDLDLYEPLFGQEVNTDRLPAYHNFSLGLSKFFLLPKGSLILFFSINNFLDRINPIDYWYNRDYSERSLAPLSRRTLYFGAVWQLND